MSRKLSQVLLVGAAGINVWLPLHVAEAQGRGEVTASVALTVNGQALTLDGVRITKGMPTPSKDSRVQAPGAASVGQVYKAGELALELSPSADSITSRLEENQKCARGHQADACRLEGSVNLLWPDGSPKTSYLVHGATVSDLSLKGHPGDAAGRAGKMKIRYEGMESAEPVAVATAPAAVTQAVAQSALTPPSVSTTSAGRLDSAPPKKHIGFGKFVTNMVKQHGLDAVMIVTQMKTATLLFHALSLAKGSNGLLNRSSQSQLSSFAQTINSSQGSRQYNVGAVPTGMGYQAGPGGEAAYLAMVRQQLVAQGADTSKFTLTTGATSPTPGPMSATRGTATPTADPTSSAPSPTAGPTWNSTWSAASGSAQPKP